MALTKVGGGIIQQPIDVGIITATSVNASGVITATSFDGNVTGDITGNVTGNLTGNVTGNVTGNITGNLTGDVTGNADTATAATTATTATNAQGLTGSPNITIGSVTATTGNFSGNLNVGGVLSYEDVTNVDSVGIVTAREGVKVPDNQKIFLGTGDDLSIYHNGTDSYVDNQIGDLILRTSSVGDDVFVRAMDDVFIQPGNGANGVTAKGSGAVELYYDNSLKLSTAAGGVNVAGNINLNSADGYEIRLGSNNDLKLYHDGNNSYVSDVGPGGLKLTGSDVYIRNVSDQDMIHASSGSFVKLYHNNSEKFATTANGATVTGTLVSDGVTSDLDLSAISASITDTAIDIFVYDTRKDSDGGAWRKRTQNTSWYNETLNTSTRGSRKEFPAVAVIIATTGSVFIYDGDDPDLPLWMKFNQSTSGLGAMVGYTSFTIGCVTMLNGLLMVGLDATNQGNVDGLRLINFISEQFSWKADSASRNSSQYWPIEDRNGGRTLGYNDENYIVSEVINDVAATVLPNSQIDDATGLPVPTIAVATRRGVSIIKDNGSVANLEHDGGTHETCRNIAFSEDKTKVLFTSDYNDDPTYNRRVIVEDIPSDDSTFTVVQDDSYQISVGGYDNNGPRILGTSNGSSAVGGIDHLLSQAAATSEGVTLLDNELDNILNSKIAYITADYNTGWMVGDIKGAFLSDTDTTNLVYTDILGGKGTFDDASYWTAGATWSVSGGVATSSTGGNNYLYKNGILTTGARYSITLTVSSYSAGTLYVYCGTGAPGTANHYDAVSSNGTFTFVLDAYNNHFGLYGAGFGGVVDNLTISSVVDNDRSTNAKDLGVFGTITKQPVATGAELVSYTGWSSSNYLRHPKNGGLDFGTGNWSYMFWYNPNDAESGDVIFSRWSFNVDGNQAPRISAYFNNGNLRVDTADASAGSGYQGHFGSDGTQDSNEWHCAVILRRGPNLEIWIDGINYKNAALNSTSDGSYTDTNSILEIGHSPGTGSTEAGLELALFRVSKSIPSPEQIKKMYEDEKKLFQENAKAALHGTSDAVTALAYDEDTELLHVGTAAGRSDFQRLRRINNTTTAVTTAISASDELIAEQ